jgi:hypothetical protein
MLREEWLHRLHKARIDPARVFTRTTVFNLEYDEARDRIWMYPCAVLDSTQSTIRLEPGHGTITVVHPLDNALYEDTPDTEATLSLNDLREVLDGASDADERGRRLQELLFRTPQLAAEICAQVFACREEVSGIKELMEQMDDLARSTRACARLWNLLLCGAYNSAFETLDPENERDPPVGKALAIAIANCIRVGRDPLPTLRLMRRNNEKAGADSISQALTQAIDKDVRAVDRFLSDGVLIDDRPSLTPAQVGAWDINHCLEAAHVAVAFQQAADKLDPIGETLASTFLKTEEAFEAAHLAVYCRPAPLLRKLQQILTGEPAEGNRTGEL